MSDLAPNTFTWSEARTADEDIVLASMRTFYAEEGLVFSESVARTAVKELQTRPELGRVFLLKAKHGAKAASAGDKANDGRAYGHLVLTFGFSLEFRGRFVLLDELFVGAEARGCGYGKVAVEFAARWAREQGVAALRLEVNRANAHARGVYLRHGFGDDERDLLTRWVVGAGGKAKGQGPRRRVADGGE